MKLSDLITKDDIPKIFCNCSSCGAILLALGLNSSGTGYCKKCKVVMFFQTDEAGDLYSSKVGSKNKFPEDPEKSAS